MQKVVKNERKERQKKTRQEAKKTCQLFVIDLLPRICIWLDSFQSDRVQRNPRGKEGKEVESCVCDREGEKENEYQKKKKRKKKEELEQ